MTGVRFYMSFFSGDLNHARCKSAELLAGNPASPSSLLKTNVAQKFVLMSFFFLAQCIVRLECMSLVNESQEQDAGTFQCLEERASTYHFHVDIFCRLHEFSKPTSLSRLMSQAVLHIFILT